MNKKNVDVIIVCIASPILIGVYENNTLIEKIEKNGRISDILILQYEYLKSKYEIKSFLYTNSPGSFLSIKLTYLFLCTIKLVKEIHINSIDGFYFNENNPIKGIFSQQFVKKNGKIILEKLKADSIKSKTFKNFHLPDDFDFNSHSKLSNLIEPNYIIPAVIKG